ncbi:MAG: hypothetical protein WHT27_01745 [candidate division WOR-3 bacterium]|jgi:hypothetical protein
MNNKFFAFINPYLKFIDNGDFFKKPFLWLYTFLALVNLIVPIYILYVAIDNKIFDGGAKYVFIFLTVWLIITFASWVSFQLWWDRRFKVVSISKIGDDFVVIPIFSHFLQTVGEWIGTWLGIVGFLSSLLVSLILGEEGSYFMQSLKLDFLSLNFVFIVLMPVISFLIIIVTRFLSEQFKAIAMIANNTKKN